HACGNKHDGLDDHGHVLCRDATLRNGCNGHVVAVPFAQAPTERAKFRFAFLNSNLLAGSPRPGLSFPHPNLECPTGHTTANAAPGSCSRLRARPNHRIFLERESEPQTSDEFAAPRSPSPPAPPGPRRAAGASQARPLTLTGREGCGHDASIITVWPGH